MTKNIIPIRLSFSRLNEKYSVYIPLICLSNNNLLKDIWVHIGEIIRKL